MRSRSNMVARLKRISLPNLLGSALLLLGALIITILLCFSPWLFKLVYGSMDYPTGYQNVANAVVKKLWDGSAIAEIHRIGPLFSKKELIHYTDISTIIRRMIFGLSGIMLILIGMRHSINWVKALTGSFLLFLIIGITLGVWALINWEHMFNTLHWWLFQNDSWKLPNSCVTLKLFPYSVWQKFGGLTLAMTLSILGISLLIAFLTQRFRKRTLPSDD